MSFSKVIIALNLILELALMGMLLCQGLWPLIVLLLAFMTLYHVKRFNKFLKFDMSAFSSEENPVSIFVHFVAYRLRKDVKISEVELGWMFHASYCF